CRSLPLQEDHRSWPEPHASGPLPICPECPPVRSDEPCRYRPRRDGCAYRSRTALCRSSLLSPLQLAGVCRMGLPCRYWAYGACTSQPASTGSVTPVIAAARCEHRNNAASATSRGSTNRRSAVVLWIASGLRSPFAIFALSPSESVYP